MAFLECFRRSCGRLVATVNIIRDSVRPPLFSGSRQHDSRSLLDLISTRMLRHLPPSSSIPRVPQAVRAPPLYGAHVALERRHVPVSRHVPFSARMPPPRIFFVLCLDAARPQCTKLHLVDHGQITNAATAEKRVHRPSRRAVIWERVEVGKQHMSWTQTVDLRTRVLLSR